MRDLPYEEMKIGVEEDDDDFQSAVASEVPYVDPKSPQMLMQSKMTKHAQLIVMKDEINFAEENKEVAAVTGARSTNSDQVNIGWKNGQNTGEIEQMGESQSQKNVLVIPKDAISLDRELQAVRIENSMQVPERSLGRRLDVANKQALTVVHVSKKAKFDMNNKTNLKRIDKENERRSVEGPRGVATSVNTQSALFLRDASATEQKPAVKMRTLI